MSISTPERLAPSPTAQADRKSDDSAHDPPGLVLLAGGR